MTDKVWLAAHFHMPSTYSIRSPASSPHNAQTLPAPSPVTVRLALIRKSLEIWGVEFTQDVLFPEIMKAKLYVEPPSGVGVSMQLLKASKTKDPSKPFADSLMYREFCHADGCLVIYLQVTKEMRAHFKRLLCSIGYWGRADSFTTCMKVVVKKPDMSRVIRPLEEISHAERLQNLERGIALQAIDENISWADLCDNKALMNAIKKSVVSFGLQVIERHGTSRLLRRHSPG